MKHYGMTNVTIKPKNCVNLNSNNFNFTVLQMNIKSLLDNQIELEGPLHTLENKGSRIYIVLLRETHLTKKMLGLVSVPGYAHIPNFRLNHKGGGMHSLQEEKRKDLDVFIEKEVETTYIEVMAKNGKHSHWKPILLTKH